MTLPDWFCPVICAGLDLKELMPSKPLKNTVPLQTEAKKYRFKSMAKAAPKKAPKLNINDFEENEALNLENQMFNDSVEDTYDYNIDMPNPCDGYLPDAKLCLSEGENISNWLMQRALNPGHLCNYDSGSCDNLFK